MVYRETQAWGGEMLRTNGQDRVEKPGVQVTTPHESRGLSFTQGSFQLQTHQTGDPGDECP